MLLCGGQNIFPLFRGRAAFFYRVEATGSKHQDVSQVEEALAVPLPRVTDALDTPLPRVAEALATPLPWVSEAVATALPWVAETLATPLPA